MLVPSGKKLVAGSVGEGAGFTDASVGKRIF